MSTRNFETQFFVAESTPKLPNIEMLQMRPDLARRRSSRLCAKSNAEEAQNSCPLASSNLTKYIVFKIDYDIEVLCAWTDGRQSCWQIYFRTRGLLHSKSFWLVHLTFVPEAVDFFHEVVSSILLSSTTQRPESSNQRFLSWRNEFLMLKKSLSLFTSLLKAIDAESM